ncbi:MAG: TetR/AcrR family transcriptional regulator [Parvibaculum sp.]|nr:TetR/AcrR family transcriptional regulator [Parvibaculum sp.]
MARKKTAVKLEDIAEAAIACFSELGLRRTQMADVAKAAGVSAGTLYLYVSSKEALLHLAILKVCARPLADLALPLADPGIAATAETFAARVKEVRHWPSFDAAAAPGARVDMDVLRNIGRELYDMLHDARRAIWLVDRCAKEVPAFERLHALDLRARHRDQLAGIAVKFAGSSDAPAPGQTLAARLAIETVAWAAMHRLRETATNEIAGLSEHDARETAASSFAVILAAAAGKAGPDAPGT